MPLLAHGKRKSKVKLIKRKSSTVPLVLMIYEVNSRLNYYLSFYILMLLIFFEPKVFLLSHANDELLYMARNMVEPSFLLVSALLAFLFTPYNKWEFEPT